MATMIDSSVLIAAKAAHLDLDNVSTRYAEKDMTNVGGYQPQPRSFWSSPSPCGKWTRTQTP